MRHDSFSICSVDKIASSTAHCPTGSPVTLSPYVVPQHGYVIAVRALEEKTQYDEVECQDGVFRHVEVGDVLVGVLGGRRALKGYSGQVPRQIDPGDTLHVLNLGGILGRCTSAVPGLGPALAVEVLGAVMVKQGGQWTHGCIQDGAIAPVERLQASVPLVLVSGTAMDTGKTKAACRVIEGLTKQGFCVGAAKLTGAALLRDARRMQEHGAGTVKTFMDAGVVCSTEADMPPVAKGVIRHLSESEQLDVIVAELGAGFAGYYGVDALLRDQELQRFTEAHVVAATDLAGVWAAGQAYRDRYHASITAVTGPVTDNDVGCHYVEQHLGIPAVNARQQGETLAREVLDALGATEPGRPTDETGGATSDVVCADAEPAIAS